MAATWAPWCAEVGYRMDFNSDGRVLLLTFDDGFALEPYGAISLRVAQTQ